MILGGDIIHLGQGLTDSESEADAESDSGFVYAVDGLDGVRRDKVV